jgi:hypothetical protein
MDHKITIFHGSQKIVEIPKYGMGKKYNDYGQGFYCTESIELAKEWACPVKNDGYANQYNLQMEGLKVMHLTHGEFNILNWLAILLKNRTFDINSPMGSNARAYLLEHFLPDTSDVDVMIGYRADDSYFSYAEDFINNTLSLRDLSIAMQLGTLGEQIVLLSPRSFEQIEYIGHEIADYREYYFKRSKRDKDARAIYGQRRKDLSALKEDLYVLDIIREEMTLDDPRLQCHLSE